MGNPIQPSDINNKLIAKVKEFNFKEKYIKINKLIDFDLLDLRCFLLVGNDQLKGKYEVKYKNGSEIYLEEKHFRKNLLNKSNTVLFLGDTSPSIIAIKSVDFKNLPEVDDDLFSEKMSELLNKVTNTNEEEKTEDELLEDNLEETEDELLEEDNSEETEDKLSEEDQPEEETEDQSEEDSSEETEKKSSKTSKKKNNPKK